MATVTGFTAERMQTIEDETIVSAAVIGGHLICTRHDGATFDAGSVVGPAGPTGPSGGTSIVVCTSGTRPAGGSLFAGLMIYETDTKTILMYDGSAWVETNSLGAWNSYAVSFKGGASVVTVGNGTRISRWKRQGRLIHFSFEFIFGTTSVVPAGNLSVSLPVPARATQLPMPSAWLWDNSAGANFPRFCRMSDASTIIFMNEAGTLVSNTVPFTWATADFLNVSGSYESAS
jgi:hypothetical protein